MIDFLSALLHQFINFLFSFTFFFLLPSFMLLFLFLVACHTPLCRSVSPSVHWTVSPLGRWSIFVSVCPSVHHTLLFLGFRVLWPHCTCPNDLVASIAAPAHPHATGVAVYPALFFPFTFSSSSSSLLVQLNPAQGPDFKGQTIFLL